VHKALNHLWQNGYYVYSHFDCKYMNNILYRHRFAEKMLMGIILTTFKNMPTYAEKEKGVKRELL